MPAITSADDLVGRLAESGVPWDRARWASFLELPPDEQALEVQMLEDAGEPPGTDAWHDVLAILQVALSVVGVASGLAGGVGTIAGAASVIRSTVKGL